MSSIGVSTHELADSTSKAMGSRCTLDDILTIWHAIGGIVSKALVQKKGVKLSSFGTFTLSTKGDPLFIVSNSFATQFKLKQRSFGNPANIPVSTLNLVAISAGTKLPRELVDKIYSKFVSRIGKAVSEGRHVLVTIHRVAEINIHDGYISCEFLQDFLRSMAKGNAPPAAPASSRDVYAEAARKTATIVATEKQYQQRTANVGNYETKQGFQIGREEAPPRQAKAKGQYDTSGRGAGGCRNPITGAGGGGGDDDLDDRRSEYSSSSYGSRRPRPASAGRARPSNGGGGGMGRRPSSAGSSQRGQSSRDPRSIAAKALGPDVIIEKVRQRIVERGGSNGIRSMGRLLKIMDDNGDQRLSRDELRYGLRDYGIDLNPTELEQVFRYFDKDGNGFIDCTEFLVGLRGDLPPQRAKFVQMAFNILDTDRSGVITQEEILDKYDMTWHPEVRSGRKTLKEAAKDFMATWDKGDRDGLVTFEEFTDYYKEISASIDDDTYFELMIRNAWRIAGGTGAAANTANKRVLVTNKDGTQGVATVHNELGMKGGDVEAVRARLKQQGIDGDIELYGGVDTTEKAKKMGGPGGPRWGHGAGAVHRRSASAPRTRGSANGSAYGSGGASPRQAWGPPGGGDESAPPPMSDYGGGGGGGGRGEYGRNNNNNNNKPVQHKADAGPWEKLKNILYNPPIPLEPLCAKLQVSSVSGAPRISEGAFAKRMSVLDPSMDRRAIKEIWSCVDKNRAGSVEVIVIHEMLTSRFGKDKSASKTAGVIDRVIKRILERCGEKAGLKGLQRTLAIMDDNGDKRLTKEEMKTGLADYGIELNIRELDEIYGYFDRDRNGFVDVDEFLIGIKGDLNERRTHFVKLAFQTLDVDHSGFITIDEMMDKYNFDEAPEVKSGKKTVQEAAREFMATWDKEDGGDGMVSFDEFLDYYKGVSASIDGDDYFELMMRNAWRIAGGTGAAANTANKRVLVTNKDGSQSVATVHNELGMKGGDVEAVRSRLKQQGIDGDIELYGGVDTTEKAKKMGGPGGPRGGHNATYSGGARGGSGYGGSQQGGYGNASRASPRAAAPRASSNPRGRGPNHNQTAPGGAAQVTATLFQKNTAATAVAAAFRGKQGRKIASDEQRKRDAIERQRREEEEERNRPRQRNIYRPSK